MDGRSSQVITQRETDRLNLSHLVFSMFFLSLALSSVALCLVNLALTTFTFALPWWTVECWKDCDEKHFIIELDIGFCTVGKKGGFAEDDCIKWNQGQKWDSIDQELGTNTHHAANYLYPQVYRLAVIALCLSISEFLVCVVALCKFRCHSLSLSHSQSQALLPAPCLRIRSLLYQILVIIAATAYQIVVVSAQSLGSDNSITSHKTWEEFTTCKECLDSPYYAYFTFAVTQTITIIITVISFSPQRLKCFHLVAFDETIDDGMSMRTSAGLSGTILVSTQLQQSEFSPGHDHHEGNGSDYSTMYYNSGIDYNYRLSEVKGMTPPSYSPPTFDQITLQRISETERGTERVTETSEA